MVFTTKGLERMETYCYEEYEYCEAFSNCPKLKEVVIPDSLDYVEGGCFRNTPWLNEREEKEKLVVIGHSFLSGRKAEGKVIIPSGVKWLCEEAFFDNKNLTELVIPATVEKLDEYDTPNIFKNCTGLKKIKFTQGSNGTADYIYVGYEEMPNLDKIIIPPSFDAESTKNLIGINRWREYPLKTNVTYCYYKGTDADTVLNSYDNFKKSLFPDKTKSFKAAAKRKAIKTSWKTVSTATGYQIQVSPDNNFKNNVTRKFINNNKKTTYTFKNLRSGVKYYVRLRTYKTFDGKKYYGKYTKVRSIITKY